MDDMKLLAVLLGEGHCLITGAVPSPETDEGMAEIRRIWRDCRESFIARWIDKHPGTRPWAWWQFDAPDEPLRVVGERHGMKQHEPQADYLDRHGLLTEAERTVQHGVG